MGIPISNAHIYTLIFAGDQTNTQKPDQKMNMAKTDNFAKQKQIGDRELENGSRKTATVKIK